MRADASRRRRFLVALVVPGDAAREIDGLRRALGSRARTRIAPHVTLVPPRNSAADDATILGHLRKVAAGIGPLELEVGPTATFSPRRPVLYLEVTHPDLADLARQLASGVFAPPTERPLRDFVAHLTLATGLAPERLAAARDSLADYRRHVDIDRLSLLEQDPDVPTRPWRVVAEVGLGTPPVVGRGGRALSFAISTVLDPETGLLLEGWEAGADRWRGGATEALVVVARVEERPVAVATGRIRGREFVLDRLVVAPPDRATGIGSQLLAHVGRVARDCGCAVLCAQVEPEGAGERLLSACGFVAVATLPATDSVAARLVLRRPIGV